ncbi:MAG: hypothetical protein ABSF95_12950 [Verrucomicrobiota bacterium]|jgi:hypothetical protein
MGTLYYGDDLDILRRYQKDVGSHLNIWQSGFDISQAPPQLALLLAAVVKC